MKNLKTISKGCLVALLLQTTTQTLIAQNTAWSTVNPIGIGTAAPTAGYNLHVNGDLKVSNSAFTTNYMDFALPASENGMSFVQGAGQRADIRFSGATLRLLARGTTPGGPPASTNGINIKTNGFVGIGNDNPSYRLNVNDNSTSDYGSWISANSKGPALFVRRDNVGTTTGSGTYTTSKQFALVVEEASGVAGIGTAYFYGQYGNGIEVNASNNAVKTTLTPTSNADMYGIFSQSTLSLAGFVANNGYGITHQDINTAQNSSIAIRGFSAGNVQSIGVYGNAGSNQTAYGVYGTAAGVTAWAGYFAGDVKATGVFVSSDAKLKENIKDLSNPLDVVLKLSPKTYSYKQSEEFLGLNMPKGDKFGLIAQELEKVLPELVKTSVNPEITDPNGKMISRRFEYKSVDYISIIPFLIGGMKQQQKEIEELKAQLSAIRGSGKVTGLGNDVSTMSPSVLYQNNPNPFDQGTIIKYALNANISQAYVMIFDMTGAIVKRYDLDPKSKDGEVAVNAKDLKPGMYIYSLITDNKEVDTKRMIINR